MNTSGYVVTPLGALIESNPAYPEPGEENLATSNGPNNSGVFAANGALFQFVLQSDFLTLQPFRSLNNGYSWQPFGASITIEVTGSGGACYFQSAKDGTMYAVWNDTSGPPNFLTISPFDPVLGTWGANISYQIDPATAGIGDGVYQVLTRPDQTYFIIFAGDWNGGTDVFGISWDGVATFGNPVQLTGVKLAGDNYRFFEAAFVQSDSVIQVQLATTEGVGNLFAQQPVNADDTLGTAVALPDTFTTLGQSGVIGYGLRQNPSSWILPVGGPVDSTLRMCWWNGAAWVITAAIDSGQAGIYATPIMLEWNGLYVCAYQAGANGLLRVGFVAPADFADPSKWSWFTGYDLTLAQPPVTGVTAPYDFQGFTGMGQQLVSGADGILRYSMFVWNNGAAPFDLPAADALMWILTKQALKITLRGVKRFKVLCGSDEPQYSEVPQAPKADRAV